MTGALILALVLATPIVLFPVALIWYVNIGGAVLAFREGRRKAKAAAERKLVTEKARC